MDDAGETRQDLCHTKVCQVDSIEEVERMMDEADKNNQTLWVSQQEGRFNIKILIQG